ncbi:plastid fibrillin [Medicago truncatula]|uniref:Plastid fibrillin n=1 Tax=Medicago truncatula TaxID=3880 RepID=G7IDZ7_MEDTR|nr:plastid fibrillin [Medicago truncatula]
MAYVQENANDDEWGSEPSADVAVAEVIVTDIETEKLKKDLVGLFYGTDHGSKAASETRAEIFELISQLEAKFPTPASTDALSLLDGKWILAYTSYAGLFPLLSSGLLPFLEVEELSQTIDSVLFAGPLTTTSIDYCHYSWFSFLFICFLDTLSSYERNRYIIRIPIERCQMGWVDAARPERPDRINGPARANPFKIGP